MTDCIGKVTILLKQIFELSVSHEKATEPELAAYQSEDVWREKGIGCADITDRCSHSHRWSCLRRLLSQPGYRYAQE